MKENTLNISVIIPTFQEARYIAPLLSRLVKIQPPVEIIVVDSNSKDKTIDIAKQYTNKVFRIKERGISKAKNFGAKQAEGKILIFLDADVKPPLDFAVKVLNTFCSSDVVGATCNIIPEHPRFFEAIFFQFYNMLIRFSFKFRSHSRGEFIVVKKESFQNVGGFNEDLPCLEDHDLAHKLSKLGEFVFIKNLAVFESLRRFRKLGFFKVVGTWITDYIFFTLKGKPKSKVWIPAR